MYRIVPQPTWQADFEKHMPYLTRMFRYRFRHLPPDAQAEAVQEAACQAAIVFASQYRRHRCRTEHRYDIARRIAGRVSLGARCTRLSGHNSDLLDWTVLCIEGKKPTREVEYYRHLNTAESRGAVSPEFKLDLAAWIDGLPDPLREYAVLAADGTDQEEIQRRLGVGVRMIQRYRQRLQRRWQDHIAA